MVHPLSIVCRSVVWFAVLFWYLPMVEWLASAKFGEFRVAWSL